jgi:hypothetical protein
MHVKHIWRILGQNTPHIRFFRNSGLLRSQGIFESENFIVRTVHKLNDCLHPMECIPETQFIMRSKIHLAVLLHLQCKCEQEEDSQFGQILL